MRKVLSISVISILLTFESVLTQAFAQGQPEAGDWIFDASNRFIVCDYEESLIEVVPDSFICGYTFSPYGYKPYGIFLQNDCSGYKAILNYYKYDRDKVDDVMSSATIEIHEWRVKGLIDAAKDDIDHSKE